MVDVWAPLDASEYADSSNHKNFERDSVYGEAIDSIAGYEDSAKNSIY